MIKLTIFICIFAISTNIFAGPSIKKLTSNKTANDAYSTSSKEEFFKDLYNNKTKKHWLGLGIGQTHLIGNTYKKVDNELGFNGQYLYSASRSFDVYVNFHYSKHTRENQWVKLPGLTIGIKGRVYTLDSLSTFLLTGLGYYWPSVNREVNGTLMESETKAVLGVNIGTGLGLKLNAKSSISFVGHFHHPFKIKQEIGRDIRGSFFNLFMAYNVNVY